MRLMRDTDFILTEIACSSSSAPDSMGQYAVLRVADEPVDCCDR